ncbi:hypothetical protein ASC97_06995 [Rhizobium sp. Root1203]|uniref:hypothetical protein n=1 Tax=Rhizobium sp. Root1203 TaxID=1736427 RepID=UPI00070D89AC|nr:hypothetical protein [Rhizobium sp. Root1203]KQV28088.1 hypothetical protein ASC97_06995 [Rhizobium sp. Root1203]
MADERIEVEDLPSTSIPSVDHRVPAMLGGLTVYLTVAQIVEFAKDKLAGWFHGAPSKVTPVDADEAPIYNSAGAVLGRVTFANLFTWIGSKFHGLTAKALPVSADEITVNDSAGTFVLKRVTLANFFNWIIGDPFAFQPIGVPFPVNLGLAGISTPNNTTGRGKYILLTAGLTGVGGYNNGLLTSESVTGSAPLVVATATVSLAGSALNGVVVRLLNTEGRIMRPGTVAGTLQDDAVQGHRHQVLIESSAPTGAGSVGGNSGTVTKTTGGPVTDGTNGTPRVDNETRMRNVAAEYYMRIA